MTTYELWDAKEARRYIHVVYTSREIAEREREELLGVYPPDHEWRRRLQIAEFNGRNKRERHEERQVLRATIGECMEAKQCGV
jgi:hypothetical protein